MRVHRSMIHVAVAEAAMLLAASLSYADILSTSASVSPDNSLIVDVQVTTDSSAAQVVVTYQASGVDPLVSRVTQVSSTGSTTITIGRLRANTTYTYTRGRVRPPWRSGGNRGRELYDRLPSSGLVDEQLHAHRAHYGPPRHSAGQPGGLPGLSSA